MQNSLFRKSLAFVIIISFFGANVISTLSEKTETSNNSTKNKEDTLTNIMYSNYRNETKFPWDNDITKLEIFEDVEDQTVVDSAEEVLFRAAIYVDDSNIEGPWDGTLEHPYQHIQDGIDAASPSDTVFVFNGTYSENVMIHKSINLIGEDRNETIIDGSGENVVTITANNANISIFTIRSGPYGIFINETSNCRIENCISCNTSLHGIKISHSPNCTIINSKIYENENYGIFVVSSPYCTIRSVDTYENDYHGIYILASDNVVIMNCKSYSSYYGIKLDSSSNCIIENCIIHGNSGYGISNYYYSDNTTVKNCDIYDNYGFGIFLEWSTGCSITDCHLHNTNRGVFLRAYSSNNHVSNCNLYDNSYTGLCISKYSENNVITNCNSFNNPYGIVVSWSANNNQIHHNNFFENENNAYDECTNQWDDGSIGNYWDDYVETGGYDSDGDGIGDIPYDIPGGFNQDRHPLMNPWEEFYLNLVDFPMYEADANPGYNEMCGPAVAKMTLDYIWWNRTEHPEGPPEMYSQQELYTWGLENNSNQSSPCLDTTGIFYTIQYNKPMPYSEYGYNFMKYNNEDLDEMLKRICLWINYTVGTVGGHKEGHPLHVPTVVPAYGDYTNWMAIRGFRSNRTAHPMPDEITIYGFWVNDPYPASLGGLGENSYKTLTTWLSDYYYQLDTDDIYNGKYVAIFEPPEINENAELTIAEPQPRFNPEQQEELKYIQLNKGLVSEDLIWRSNEWIIQAAIEGVAEELIPYDEDFASAFEKTIAGTPVFVENTNGNDYYAVPFNVLVKKSKSLDLSKKVISKDSTIIVILIDAQDGSFKEASWVKDPVEYLPVSREEARKISVKLIEELDIELEDIDEMKIELVHRHSTPYYPDWRVTIKEFEIYISQDGAVSY